MDPNEALKGFRDNVRLARNAHTEGEKVTYMTYAVHAIEYLDEWLTKGGFPPADWDRTKTQAENLGWARERFK